ncbi:hypothetical protein [Kitasatospora sp. NPDC059673]|uniref:hypothetical protein n=1 Tax=Kitasatospora sp. NPDC059673 TaxID=3346901 RepID=UPI0036B2F23A
MAGPAESAAAALCQARQSEHTPPCWRVLHRVTFVSRKLPGVIPADAPRFGLEKAMRAVDISSSFELVRRLEPYVDPAAQDTGELARQVREAITLHLPELTDHTDQITRFMADYYSLAQPLPALSPATPAGGNRKDSQARGPPHRHRVCPRRCRVGSDCRSGPTPRCTGTGTRQPTAHPTVPRPCAPPRLVPENPGL